MIMFMMITVLKPEMILKDIMMIIPRIVIILEIIIMVLMITFMMIFLSMIMTRIIKLLMSMIMIIMATTMMITLNISHAVPWPELNPRPKSKHKRMESLQSTGFHNYSANLTIFSNFLLQKPLSTPTRFSDIFEKTASSRRSFSVAGSALLSVELPTHERSRFCQTDFA